MKIFLKKKQSSNNDDWLWAMSHIEELISEKEVDAAVDEAVREIVDTCKYKNVAYGWSGGKDSIALQYICEKAGISKSFFGHSELDFPAFSEWCAHNMPDGCEVIETPRTYKFLQEHPSCLFPNHSDRDAGQTMFIYGPRFSFRKWFELHPETDFIMVGHRIKDGNFIGDSNGFMRNNHGVLRWSPIRHWPHEIILGIIHYKGMSLPPNYGYWNGFVNGTHCWNDTVGIDTIEQGWDYINEIDRSIIVKAAKYDIPKAKEYLLRR